MTRILAPPSRSMELAWIHRQTSPRVRPSHESKGAAMRHLFLLCCVFCSHSWSQDSQIAAEATAIKFSKEIAVDPSDGQWERTAVGASETEDKRSHRFNFYDKNDIDHHLSIFITKQNPDEILQWERSHRSLSFTFQSGAPRNWYINEINPLVKALDVRVGKISTIFEAESIKHYRDLVNQETGRAELREAVDLLNASKIVIIGQAGDGERIVELGWADRVGGPVTSLLSKIVFDEQGVWTVKCP